MSGTPPRPEPLRVPVVDVALRSSLVAPSTPAPKREESAASAPKREESAASAPKREEPAPPAPKREEPLSVVVQRPVRFISDVPPRTGNGTPSAPPPAMKTAAAPAPAPTYRARASTPPPEDDEEEDDDDIDDEIDDDDKVDDYASVEVESIDPLELSDEYSLDPQDAEPHVEHEEIEPTPIQISRPPPAPKAAMRATVPNNEVEITLSFDSDDDEEDDEDDDDGRPSGEFEELDVEAESLKAGTGKATPPPPPPAGLRVSMPDGPDLSALTQSSRVAEARPSKPRPHPWWEVFFDDDYLRTVRPPTSDQVARQADFIAKRLRLKPGAAVLDVGCGLGLSVVELASRGYLGVGLDLSLPMLSRASEEAQSRGMRINFLHADMRDMNFDGAFDAIICLGTTFGYFDDEANRRVLDRMHRALKPNGSLLIDVVNRDHVIRSQPNLVWFEGDGCVCMEESEFNFFTSRLHVKRTVILDQGKQRENEYSLRMYSLHELGQLLHSQGFRVTEVSGREALPGVFFGNESPNVIIVAERRNMSEATGKYATLGSES